MSDDRVERAERELLEGVGDEIAASFPGVTRLGGQIVAALFLAEQPRSMDELSQLLGRSKSNISGNIRGLLGFGIINRRRAAGARHDVHALNGPYPDVIVGAYISRLRQLVSEKRSLARRSLATLGDATGPDAERLRSRLDEVKRKYDLFSQVMAMLPIADGPIDLERVFSKVDETSLEVLVKLASEAWGPTD